MPRANRVEQYHGLEKKKKTAGMTFLEKGSLQIVRGKKGERLARGFR